MPLPQIFSPAPGEPGLSAWAFAHHRDHLAINAAIRSAGGGNFLNYVLDPIDEKHLQEWLLRHQLAHNNMNSYTKYEGVDLQTLNLKDRVQVKNWFWYHFNEHNAAHAKLKF